MATFFRTWTALPHGPIEKVGENLWSVSGTMPKGSIQRRMTVARLESGGLAIHNAIALDDASMRELEAFGEPEYLLVPNAFHRQDAFIFKQRYPKLRVLCPRNAASKVAKVVPVEGSYDEFPADARVRVFHLRGLAEREGAMLVESDSGTTAVFCDAVLNLPPRGGPMGFLLSPTGRPSVPRFTRWMIVRDKPAFRAHLEEIAGAPSLARVMVGHGRTIADNAGPTLRSIAAELA